MVGIDESKEERMESGMPRTRFEKSRDFDRAQTVGGKTPPEHSTASHGPHRLSGHPIYICGLGNINPHHSAAYNTAEWGSN